VPEPRAQGLWILERCQNERFPYRLQITRGAIPWLVLRVQDRWPAANRNIFCLREKDPPEASEVLGLRLNGATVAVQYTGVRWSDGSAYDSTWVKGEPKSFDLGAGILPGLAEGLVEQTVGSQVLIVIPPASGGAAGAEDDTLVFVVDILAASNPRPGQGG